MAKRYAVLKERAVEHVREQKFLLPTEQIETRYDMFRFDSDSFSTVWQIYDTQKLTNGQALFEHTCRQSRL